MNESPTAPATDTLAQVRDLLVETLGIQGDSITASTELFGSMPELDSLAIVQVATEIENQFGFEVDDEDITGDVFETVGSLTAYVDSHRP
ncbi:acyl carrier protein [Luteipulveratus mongoliensis]|uniref:Acyl carrier protein n=1 Tax=Luteipulveratus mongoliensis TaxID=571913 RepID=A0A0K1JGT9_9MICO|nr:phosphopantetheine-binding protein [Luteipulveratus mongoliensis]AKU15921.1 acyl carrier protein [Luteipulveratus mongoliensis]